MIEDALRMGLFTNSSIEEAGFGYPWIYSFPEFPEFPPLPPVVPDSLSHGFTWLGLRGWEASAAGW